MNVRVGALLGLGLAFIAALAFLRPHALLAPGDLIEEHAALTNDCFACHAPLRGVDSARCARCHKPADIGRVTTAGQVLTQSGTAARFHQALAEPDCTACHSDHRGVLRLISQPRFEHALIKADMRSQCADCHRAPADSLHVDPTMPCGSCHGTAAWRPATFDHQRYFELDRAHDVACVTCHRQRDYRQYSCYGCHEHTPGRIRRAHAELRARALDDCVACHRSAREEDDD